MAHLRQVVFAVVLLTLTAVAPMADAGCVGTICGAVCGGDYACHSVTDTYDTLACKEVSDDGCMSMHSIVCCPPIPRE